jgi:tetratricopeptide (TPR) repeat protein
VETARLVAEADSLATKKRYEDASVRYLAALESWPESLAIAKRALGSFWRAGRDDEAYVWGRRVVAREPRSPDALFDLGVTCGFLVDRACADSAFRGAIAVDSTFVDGYCELGFIAQARGNMTEAIRYMEAACAVAPDDPFAVSGLAQMLIPAGQAARARALMIPRIAADRASRAYGGRSMLTLYAWACLALRDSSGANSAFDEVLRRLEERERAGQTSYQLYRERAAIYALRGQRDAAIAAMQSAFAHGWRLYGSWALVDPMFASIARDPAVIALLERMRSEVREMRRRLDMQPDTE